MRSVIMTVFMLLAVFGGNVPAVAAYPDRPINMIVAFPPGSPVDQSARYIARILEEKLGQPVVVENKTGAGGLLATEAVARARANGYTVLFTSASSITTAAAMYKSLPYDPQKDLMPVIGLNTTGLAINVHDSVPAKTPGELIDYMKANPNKLSFASAGMGTSPHLAGELFMLQTGTKMVHIPYKGGPPANVDLLAGNVHILFAPTSAAGNNAATGKTRVLAVLGPERTADLPGIPTVAELGFPQIGQSPFWFGVFFPKDTPSDIVQTVEKTLSDQLKTPESKKQLSTMGLTGTVLSRQEVIDRIEAEIKSSKDVVQKANIPLQ